MSDWGYFKPSKPIEAKGGIKSQGKRSGAANWWAKRWLEVLDGCGLGARLTRGRSYARRGQVLSLQVRAGEVTAKVQGSRPKPYDVRITVAAFTSAEWDRVIETLSEQAVFAASLLAGSMPQDIESAFAAAGLSLLPDRMSDLDTDCSCPDWSNPCKHTAAVYCLLGDEFDRDPFLIFTLRGLNQEQIRTRLTGSASTTTDATAPPPPEPLSTDPILFWGGAPAPDTQPEAVHRPPVSAPLLRRLGSFPFWRADVPLLEALEPAYQAASETGIHVFMGEGHVPPRTDDRPR